MLIPILALIPVSFIMAFALSVTLRWVGTRLGHLDSAGSAGHAKTDLRRVPNIGGIAIVIAIVAPAVVGMLALRLWPAESLQDTFPSVVPHLAGVAQRTPMALAVLGAIVLVHIMGLVDDRRALGPGPKILVQFVAAFLIVLVPWDEAQATRLLTLLKDVPGLSAIAPWPSIIVTVLWLVVVMNAINFMDNMDGLAAGVGAIASALFLVAAMVNGQWFIAAMLALLVGALLGFLVLNFPPASIFMGDGGSLVVGLLLGFLTVRTTWVDPDATTNAWYGLFMPLIVLAVPIYDLLSVVFIRIRQGRNPMVGDQQHFSHRLMQRGLNPRQTLCVIYGVTLATGITGIFLGSLTQGWQALLAGAQVIIMLAVLAVYEHAVRRAGNGARP